MKKRILWKIILEVDTHPVFECMLNFIADPRERREVLSEWHSSRMIALLKKGDLGDCSNYRSTSLINVGYKLYA